MLVYAGLAIVLANIFWLTALKRANATMITNASFLMPLFTLFFACLILNERPSGIEFMAFIIIFIGIGIASITVKRKRKLNTSSVRI